MDILVYILWDLVLPDVMMDHVRTANDLQRKIWNLGERRRRALAYAYTGNISFIS
jgi:hypothetical protein